MEPSAPVKVEESPPVVVQTVNIDPVAPVANTEPVKVPTKRINPFLSSEPIKKMVLDDLINSEKKPMFNFNQDPVTIAPKP